MNKQSKKLLKVGKNVRINNERDVWRLEAQGVDGWCVLSIKRTMGTNVVTSTRMVHASKLGVVL